MKAATSDNEPGVTTLDPTVDAALTAVKDAYTAAVAVINGISDPYTRFPAMTALAELASGLYNETHGRRADVVLEIMETPISVTYGTGPNARVVKRLPQLTEIGKQFGLGKTRIHQLVQQGELRRGTAKPVVPRRPRQTADTTGEGT